MGQTKAKFDLQDVELANFTRALALPARISIIRTLLKQEDWVPSTRFDCLPLSPQVIERHLNALKTAGLICKMSRNSITFCKLNTENFRYQSGYLAALVK